jgi:hypothetical protein
MIEPITAATDVLLAVAAASFAVLIVRASTDKAARLLAGALAVTAFGALAGAAYHMARSSALWKVSAVPIGVASYLFGLAVAVAYLSPPVQRIARVILGLQLAAYVVAVALSDDFRVVIADYATVMLAILVLCLLRLRDIAARWLAASVVISFAAAGVQMSTFRAGPLNHNDLYHLVELLGLFCMYRGGRLLRTRVTAPPKIQPT